MESKRWDPIVKLTHWGIVAAVIGNALVTEEGSGWHIWLGYGLAALLALRLLWGLVGPREARFGSFPPSLARARQHLDEIRRGEVVPHSSHNPLGALMVYAIWATLLVVTGTGIAMSGPPPANPSAVHGERGEREGKESESDERVEAEKRGAQVAPVQNAIAGPSSRIAAPQVAGPRKRDDEDEATEERRERGESRIEEAREGSPVAAVAGGSRGADADAAVEQRAPVVSEVGERVESSGEAGEEEGEEEEGPLGEVHELAVNLLYVLIALHLAGVVFETRRSGSQIVRAMLPGGRQV